MFKNSLILGLRIRSYRVLRLIFLRTDFSLHNIQYKASKALLSF